MKQFRILSIILCFAVIFVMLLAACGEKASDATGDEAQKITETTVILETTAEGGTVEQDSEGNKITKDAEGKVVYVVDVNGNTIDVVEYVTTHSWIENSSQSSDNSSGSSSAGGNGSSGGSGKKTDENNSSSAKDSSDTDEEIDEESIPVVIATVPDEEDMGVISDPDL